MNELSCIIVDDEAIARDTLRLYLQKYCSDVKVLDSCENIEEAKRSLNKYNPNIVFLDIEMPYGNGFDLLEQLGEVNFEVIFITAFSNYAIQALNLSATHYILKPIDIDELIIAIEKVKKKNFSGSHFQIQSQVLIENLQKVNSQLNRIVLPHLNGFDVVPVKSILYAQAADNYCEIHLLSGEKFLISKPLKFYDDLLSSMGFIRIHKSYLINGNEIVSYRKGKTGQVVLSNGSVFDISNSRKKDFLAYFSR
ncbi:LytR/AlgR family response regulator transcription factor [Crocinitomix algicola]|uniref:LytR/AlgR family response regulator transcription factor n=1 Tax=Crocinitomix algicola TaxID=1740263 RepID=UPI00082A210E|nr:LytTR family DNA-binding domain-containing protein [Crocinitomix algicola]